MGKEEYLRAREIMEEKIQLARKEFKEAGYLYLKNNKLFPKHSAVIMRDANRCFSAVTTGEYKLSDHSGTLLVEIAYGWETEFVLQEKLEKL